MRSARPWRCGRCGGDGGRSAGLLSLIVWALTATVTIKYIFFVTRADNKGEGGTLSLMSLARSGFAKGGGWITALGVIGAALFFGDAIITPAIRCCRRWKA